MKFGTVPDPRQQACRNFSQEEIANPRFERDLSARNPAHRMRSNLKC